MSRPWLLLGGAGYVGTHLGRAFTRARVPFVSRDAADGDFTREVRTDWIEAADAVLLLAGRIRHPSPEVLLRDNLDICRRVAEAYGRASCRPPLFFLSSLHVYRRSDAPVSIDSSTRPPRAYYGAVKLACEQELANAAAQGGFPLWIGRAGNLVGLEEPLNPASFLADFRRSIVDEGRITVRGSPSRDIVRIEDFASGLRRRRRALASLPLRENVCTGRAVRLEALAGAIADLRPRAGVRIDLVDAPEPDVLVGIPADDAIWGAGPAVADLARLVLPENLLPRRETL